MNGFFVDLLLELGKKNPDHELIQEFKEEVHDKELSKVFIASLINVSKKMGFYKEIKEKHKH